MRLENCKSKTVNSKHLCWLLLPLWLTGCVTVRGYEKMYLSDEEMQLKERTLEQFEISIENYREGASGANDGQVGGGCGCN